MINWNYDKLIGTISAYCKNGVMNFNLYEGSNCLAVATTEWIGKDGKTKVKFEFYFDDEAQLKAQLYLAKPKRLDLNDCNFYDNLNYNAKKVVFRLNKNNSCTRTIARNLVQAKWECDFTIELCDNLQCILNDFPSTRF